MSKMLKVVGASWLQTKISSYVLGFLGVLAIIALFAGQIERSQEDGNYAATVFYSEKTGYRIEYWGQSNKLADLPRGVARAYFRMDMKTTGWSLLEVETDGTYRDDIQAYAAGIVEGALTSYLIHTHLDNTVRAVCGEHARQCDRVKDELDKSVNIWKSYAAEREATDPFWHHVSLYYTQISGMYTGWKHGSERNANTKSDTDISELYWLNSMADVVELQRKMNITIDNNPVNKLPGLSSAFLRVVNETLENGTTTKRIYLAHNAAGSYLSMTRILKKYKLNYRKTSTDDAAVPGLSVEFSGYPGSVTSQDEFYVIRGDNHRMAVAGTTLRNYNKKLWKSVNITEQLPVGPRVAAANKLSANVSSWGRTLAAHNSGTATKQWLVVDFAHFHHIQQGKVKDRKEIVTEITVNNLLYRDVKHTIIHRWGGGRGRGAAWLLEQAPGRTQSADLTAALLDKHYWATYGLPFFKDVAELTHVTKMEAIYGKMFSESESPRAVTFKQGYKNATSLDSIIQLMRMNNITALSENQTKFPECSDELNCLLEEADLWSALGARGDIVRRHQEAYGVIDTKVVSGTTDGNSLDLVAISSPPFTEPPKLNLTEIKFNKGNVASIYTDAFDDEPTIDGLQIRDLVKQKAEEELEMLNKDILQPFQWSESSFKDITHEGLPDKWAFGPFKPQWSW
ncbi:putative phospholipase B-like lamina ancestor isoform X1 [Papilio machaon]|uniref:putative phospholipase B-like lamina ancestor isoform X1 n=1 Tax=Papilio machaon TaxID=76193 RepID=UPI001E6631FF|nr:putative phospholipase B-like lamina ancestor isoform X1 [Papilio machaon]XP_045536389.1 putative phospholipase B-like lamina ancestor isoform X1 [Papilio machaon]